MTIEDVGYELNVDTTSDTQVEFASGPDRITHINNVIIHQNLFSSQMISIQQ